MNPPDLNPDPKRLVDEYFLRDFTRGEIDELNTALEQDAELKAEFIKNVHDDLDLYEAIQYVQEEQHLRERALFYARRKSARTTRLNRINKIAAALVALLSVGGLVYFMMKPPPARVIADSPAPPVPIARVTDLFLLDGDRIPVENEVGRRPLRVGDQLVIGDALTVPAGGRLSMKYLSDSTAVSFEENSSFKLSESNGAKHLELFDGRIVADVAKQPQGKPFRIKTDDAELVVLGTRFELMNRKETVLSVLAGKVQMNNLSKDDSVTVPAGYYAEGDQGKLSKPTAFRHEKLKPVYSRTLPGIPRNHQKAGNQYIIVDPERNLKGRIDFNIPRLKGRIVNAELRLRVVPFETDRAGGGTIRVKRADRKNAPDMGRHSGRVKAGMDLIFSIDPSQLTEGSNKLLLALDKGGNDFWFGAKDSRHPPELHLTIVNK